MLHETESYLLIYNAMSSLSPIPFHSIQFQFSLPTSSQVEILLLLGGGWRHLPSPAAALPRFMILKIIKISIVLCGSVSSSQYYQHYI